MTNTIHMSKSLHLRGFANKNIISLKLYGLTLSSSSLRATFVHCRVNPIFLVSCYASLLALRSFSIRDLKNHMAWILSTLSVTLSGNSSSERTSSSTRVEDSGVFPLFLILPAFLRIVKNYFFMLFIINSLQRVKDLTRKVYFPVIV